MKNRFRRKIIYFFLKLLNSIVLRVEERPAEAIGVVLGEMSFLFLPRMRRTALFNLTFAFEEEKTSFEIRRIAREVFRNLGRNLVEILRFPLLDKDNIDRFISTSGLEQIDRALKKEKGVIILTSHFGNWELLGAYLSLKGYRGAVIARRIYFEPYEQLLRDLRRRVNIEVIDRRDSARKALEALKRNEVLGILPDQDVDSVSGVFVDFFGKPAYTPSGPVNLALASGASLIPCYLIRERRGHRLVVEEPLKLEEFGDKEETLIRNTEKWSKITESYIRRYPGQWVWMHERWKTSPPLGKKI